MTSECCLSVTKYFLFLFNLIFFFLGLSLLGLGIWIICSDFPIPVPSYLPLSHLSYLLIISGSVTFLLGFFGSLGALKEVKCMLAVYFILLTVLLAAQTIGTVLLFTQKSAFETSLETHVTELMQKPNSSLHKSLEYFQQEAKCCGWKTKEDWAIIPCSCFERNATANATDLRTCNCEEFKNSTCVVYKQNCGDIIIDWVNKNLLVILGVVLALAVVECLQWLCLATFCCLNHTNRCCPARNTYGSHGQLSRSQSASSIICGIILSMSLYKQDAMNFSMHS